MRKYKIRKIAAISLAFTMIIGNTAFASKANVSREDLKMLEIEKHIVQQNPSLGENEVEVLSQEIYQEKYITTFADISNENNEAFVDVAYENMMTKENYIVDLVATHSGTTTSLDAWEYNLEYLQLHYEDIMALENVNTMYVDSYIEDYEVVKSTQNMAISQINIGMRTSYSSSDAVTYAETYYSNYNSSYPDWSEYGGDCANFISQCLYAGGKNMKGTPGTSSAAEDWSNWFSKGTSCNTKNVSSTWRGANAFRNYWQSNANGYTKFTSVGSSSYQYGFKGDAISLLNSNGSAYHTLIIVGYDSANNDFIVAAHTGNTKTAKLSNYSAPGGFIILDM